MIPAFEEGSINASSDVLAFIVPSFKKGTTRVTCKRFTSVCVCVCVRARAPTRVHVHL